jgi:ribose-phosphate pyrophosphokinase
MPNHVRPSQSTKTAESPTPKLNKNDVRFFSGESNKPLAQSIADYAGVPLEDTRFGRYSNDNLAVQLGASVRGRAVYIVQSLTKPVSDHLIQLLMMLDIAHGAGAREIHAVIPYFSYARSDKKDQPRISITARLIADLLRTAGATHVMTMTLHAPQVHGFFSVPTDPITARAEFVRHFSACDLIPDETVVVAPDFGRAGSAARLAEQLGLTVAVADKLRLADDKVDIGKLVNRQVKGFKTAIIYDDEIATGSTTLTLCDRLIHLKIKRIYVACTHGLFTRDAQTKLAAVPEVKQIVSTDTVEIGPEKRNDKMVVLPVGRLFGEAILRNANRESISDLYSYHQDKQPGRTSP